jgi:hypothetical protein
MIVQRLPTAASSASGNAWPGSNLVRGSDRRVADVRVPLFPRFADRRDIDLTLG